MFSLTYPNSFSALTLTNVSGLGTRVFYQCCFITIKKEQFSVKLFFKQTLFQML